MAERESLEQVEVIFQWAVSLRGTDRQEYLSRACAGNRSLRREVESLLEADEQSENLLDFPLKNPLDSPEIARLLKKENLSLDRRRANMQSIQCSKGHFYNPEEHVTCPYCGIVGLADFSPTQPVVASPPPLQQASPQNYGGLPKPADDGPTQGRKNLDEGMTVGVFKAKIGIEPVVGWLVCVDGGDKGRDYRIRAQRNFIGRDVGMDICISGDNQISKENHATLIYDPRSNTFRLAPGDSHGITYLNNESVDVPMTLKPYDVIELGVTKLLFVPLCGQAFQWQ